MANINPNNHAVTTGRLTTDPKVFGHRDGSKTALFTVAADHDYDDKSDYVSFEGFVPANAKDTAPLNTIGKGDMVQVDWHAATDTYVKNGETVYQPKNKVDSIQYREPKSVTQARKAENLRQENARLQTQAEQAPQAQAPAPQKVQVPAAAQAQPAMAVAGGYDTPPF